MPQAGEGQKLQHAFALHQQGRLTEAAAAYRAILAENPQSAEALHLLGVASLQMGDAVDALARIEKAVALQPGNPIYRSNLGLALSRCGRLEEALGQFDRSLAIEPNSPDAHNHRGNVLRALGRPEQALAAYARALVINPAYADALNNRGAALADLNRADAAIASFNRCLAVDPNHVGALSNRGALRVRRKEFEAALTDLDRSTALNPGNPVPHNNRGNALCGLLRLDEAVTEFDAAIRLDPLYADAFYNRATAFSELRRFGEALADAERALSLDPRRADAMTLRGQCLQQLDRRAEALACYDQALHDGRDNAELLVARAHLLAELGRLKEAAADFDRAYAIGPAHELLRGWRALCKLRICEWRNIESELHAMTDAANAGQPVCSPAVLLAVSGDPAVLANCARSFAARNFPAVPSKPFLASAGKERLNIGYFSADFHVHATAWLAAGLFEQHDRSRFTVSGFSYGRGPDDAMRQRLRGAFDGFFDTTEMSDGEVVQLARESGIDIAIDLKGYTEGGRPEIFRQRAAPVQVSFLGYPGTLGTEFMDYVIADEVVIPQSMARHYSESIAWLPDCYQPNDSGQVVPAPVQTRAQHGLPEGAFVFCCFNNSYKIRSEIFELWMRLLQRVAGSVLWLLEDNSPAAANLACEASAQGVDPSRLVFAKRVDHAQHLARHQFADLCLDTLPYGAHTTASDALWAGTPLLTCAGTAFQGRVAASLLRAIGLPELITDNLDYYEQVALTLASGPDTLRAIRTRLAANRNSQPLFDTAQYARNLESAFMQIWRRHLSGAPPQSFQVPRAPATR